MKRFILTKFIISFFILGNVNAVQGQSIKFDNYFLGASYSYDIMMLSDKVFPPYDPDLYLMGFWSYGIEVGKRNQRRAFSMYYRFGENVNEPDIAVGNGINNEFEIEKYFQIGVLYRWQFNKYRTTNSTLHFNFGVRNMLSLAHFKGFQLINVNSNDESLVDYNDNAVGIESGLYFEVGRNAGNKPGFFVNLEPFHIMLTNKGLGAGILKLSGIIQF